MIRDKQLNREVIDACNLLGKLAEDLPDGWDIEMRFSNEEASIAVMDPEGNEHHVAPDYEAHFLALISLAREKEGLSDDSKAV